MQRVTHPILRQVSQATSNHRPSCSPVLLHSLSQNGNKCLRALTAHHHPPTYAAFENGCPKALEVPTLYQLLFCFCCELSCHTGLGNKARTASWWNGSKAPFVCFLPLKGKMMSRRKGEGTRKLLVTLTPEFRKLIA